MTLHLDYSFSYLQLLLCVYAHVKPMMLYCSYRIVWCFSRSTSSRCQRLAPRLGGLTLSSSPLRPLEACSHIYWRHAAISTGGMQPYLLEACSHIYWRHAAISTGGMQPYLLEACSHIYWRHAAISTGGMQPYLLEACSHIYSLNSDPHHCLFQFQDHNKDTS